MVFVDQIHATIEPPSIDPSQMEGETNATQWIVIHDNLIVGFYGSQGDANDAMNGYRMNTSLDINSNLGIFQIT